MRGYGLPRLKFVEHPDCCDMAEFGLKPSRGCLKKKCGKYAGQRPSSKASSRRVWKKKERQRIKKELNVPIN